MASEIFTTTLSAEQQAQPQHAMLLVPVVTIDGPTASGKGTIGKLLARKLGWNFLDSGAIYRTLALAAILCELDAGAHKEIVALAHNLQLEFNTDVSGKQKIIYQGSDVTVAIRQEACGIFASQIAILPEVRGALLDCQRRLRQPPGLVADGRDMGTIVFPDAILKVFLTASAEIRAERRFRQLQDGGISANLRGVRLDLAERDQRDAKRIYAPLKPADGAFILDASDLTVDEVVNLLFDKLGACLLL